MAKKTNTITLDKDKHSLILKAIDVLHDDLSSYESLKKETWLVYLIKSLLDVDMLKRANQHQRNCYASFSVASKAFYTAQEELQDAAIVKDLGIKRENARLIYLSAKESYEDLKDFDRVCMDELKCYFDE